MNSPASKRKTLPLVAMLFACLASNSLHALGVPPVAPPDQPMISAIGAEKNDQGIFVHYSALSHSTERLRYIVRLEDGTQTKSQDTYGWAQAYEFSVKMTPGKHRFYVQAESASGLLSAYGKHKYTLDVQFGPEVVTPLMVNGDPGSKVNLVIVGDAYTVDEQNGFVSSDATLTGLHGFVNDADKFVTALFNNFSPYKERKSDFNVYRVNAISVGSGVYSKSPKKFAFGSTTVNNRMLFPTKMENFYYALLQVPNVELGFMITNMPMAPVGLSSGREPLGQAPHGQIASTAYASNSGFQDVYYKADPTYAIGRAAHEFSHSAGGLGDEYIETEYQAAGSVYPFNLYGEPYFPNVTANTDPAMSKWSKFLGIDTLSGFKVGFFEGAVYQYGVWTPTEHCLMGKGQGAPLCLCAICRNSVSNFINQSLKIVNADPSVPILTGQNTGVAGQALSFSSYSTDPDNDSVRYTFDWGDGTKTNLPDVPSGTTSTTTKTWNAAGTYKVSVVAEDPRGGFSGWSQAITVTVSAN